MRGTDGFPLRVQYTKHGKVRFVGHRDLARAFERAFRIAQLPLAFSEGFNPHPKVSFGLALSVGYESDAEYLDLELTDEFDCDTLPALLSAALPVGIDVTAARPLADRAPALQEAVTLTEWSITVSRDNPATAELSARIDAVLAAPTVEVLRTRKGKTVPGDIRPAIRGLGAEEPCDGSVRFGLELSNGQTANARPAEVLDALVMLPAPTEPFTAVQVLRTHQWIERDGARLSPLDADERRDTGAPAPASVVRPLEARAS